MSVKREEWSPSSSIFFCNFFSFKWGRSAYPTDKIRKPIFWSYLFAWILWDKINIDTHRFSHRHISKIEENKLVCHRRMSLKSCERKRWKVCFRWKPGGDVAKCWRAGYKQRRETPSDLTKQLLTGRLLKRNWTKGTCFAIFTSMQGGIKCGNRGTGFLDSEGSHR